MALRRRAWILAVLVILLQHARHARVQGEECSNGFPGFEDSGVCCVEGCGQCGGDGCSEIDGYSAEECCTSDIEEIGELCADKGEAPCVIESDEDETATPPPSPASTSQPFVDQSPVPTVDQSPAPTVDQSAEPVVNQSTAPMMDQSLGPVLEPAFTSQPTLADFMPDAEPSAGSMTIPWSLQDTEAWMIYASLSVTIANLANLWYHIRFRYRRGRYTSDDIAARSSLQNKVELHRYLILAAFVFEIGQGIAITFLASEVLELSSRAVMYVVYGVVVTVSSCLLRRAARFWQALVANTALEGLFVGVILGCFVKPSKGSTVLLILLAANEAVIGLAIYMRVGHHATTSASACWSMQAPEDGGEHARAAAAAVAVASAAAAAQNLDVYYRQSPEELRQEYILVLAELAGIVLLPVGLTLLQPQFAPSSPWQSHSVTAWWLTCTFVIFSVSVAHFLPPGRYSAYGQGGATFVSATLNTTFVVSAFACLFMMMVSLLAGDDVPLFDYSWTCCIIFLCIFGAFATHRWNVRTFWNQVIS